MGHPHYKWGKKSFFFYVRYQKWPYFDYLKNIQKMLIFAQFLAEPFIIVSKNNFKKMKKMHFWPYSWLFLIWLKLAHFQPNNGPHSHYNDVRSNFIIFFSSFLNFFIFLLNIIM